MVAPTVTWKKRILLPIWFVRMCAMVFMIAVFGIAIKVIKDDEQEYRLNVAAVVVYLIFMVAVLLLDVAQIIMFMLDKLSPPAFLIISAVQTGFWAGNVLMELIYIGRYRNYAGGLGLLIFLFILYVSLLVYAAVGYHRTRNQRKLGQYAPAPNPAIHGYTQNLPAYTGPAIANLSAAYPSPTRSNGDLTQHSISQPPHPNHDEAASSYTEMPAEPVRMV